MLELHCSKRSKKLCYAGLPPHLQPDIVMLLPKLLEPADHGLAAKMLATRMAEAAQQGPHVAALLRLPFLATLSLLHLEEPAYEEAVHTAAQVQHF